DLIHGQKRLLRVVQLVLDNGSPLAGYRQLRVRHWRQKARQFRAVQRQSDPRRRGDATEIDRADTGMGEGTADENRMKHSRKNNVGDDLSLPREQPLALPP